MQTILIVEDDDALRGGHEFDLAEEKYVVIGAHNKETVLEISLKRNRSWSGSGKQNDCKIEYVF